MQDAGDPVISAGEAARMGAVRWVDARAEPDAATAYAEGHVQGAVRADLERDLSAPGDDAHGGRHPLPPVARFAARLGAWGINPQTRVVAYDAHGGAKAAARLWWMLRALGHEHVWVLDGGLDAARAAGLPISVTPPVIEAQAPYPAQAWGWPTVDAAQVEAMRHDPTHRLLDVRAAVRYRGETEPLDPVAGHIPGARNLPLSENLDDRGAFKSRAELRGMYGRFLGDVAPRDLVVYCGSGVTACHTLLALERAQLSGAALYVGSWSEWCRSDRPKVTRP